MPTYQVHKLFRKLLGLEKYWWVDKLVDYPSRFLGRKHRKLFHDLETTLLLYLLTGDVNVVKAHLLHILVDKLFSKR